MVSKSLNGLLILEAVNQDLKAGQIVKLNEDQAGDAQVKLAVKQGHLISLDDAKVEVVNEVVKKAVISSVTIDVEDDSPKTRMASWDAFSGELADKEGSKKLVSEQMKSSDVPAIQKGEVDFSEEAEASREDIKKTVKKMAKRKTAKKKETTKKKSKIARIESEEDEAFVDKKEPDEIGFVDQEQDIERLKKHPILSKKLEENIAGQNGEVS